MELKDFVAETLNQIIDGVMIAQEHVKEKGAEIAPRGLSGADREKAARDVEFDVAVTQVEGSQAKASIGVLFTAVGLGGQTGYEAKSSIVNRIKFSIPIVLPKQ